MAVIPMQQVDPWGAMAANLAGSLISNMLQQSREANQNRKLNALMGEVQNAVNAPQAQNFMAQSQVMPEGYDVDPWAAAMHKSYSPMTQYNIGTADVNPLVQAQKPAIIQDYRNEVARQLATKRFGMLNPAAVEQYMTPFYNSLTQQNQENKTQQAIDAIRNAQGDNARLLEAQLGAAGGHIPAAVLSSIQAQNNFGANMEYNTSKDTQAQNNFMRNFEAGRDDSAWEHRYKDRILRNEEEAARYARENPAYTSVVQGDDGGQWIVNPFGETKKLNTGEPDENLMWIKHNQAKIENLAKEREELMKLYEKISTVDLTGESPHMNSIKERLNEINREIKLTQNDILARVNNRGSKQTASQSYDTAYKKTPNSQGWKFGTYIDAAASKHDVDPALIQAIIQAESAENPKAVSSKEAQGLMQLMPKTAKMLGVTDPFDVQQNINGGTEYFARLLKQYGGDVEKALWAYNAGPGNVAKGYMPDETKKYIQNVLTNFKSNSARSLDEAGYDEMLKHVQAGKYPNIHNEKELQQYLDSQNIKYNKKIQSSDVKPFSNDIQVSEWRGLRHAKEKASQERK